MSHDDKDCSPGAGVTAGAGCGSGRHCGGWSVVSMVSSDESVLSGYYVNIISQVDCEVLLC